MTKSVTSYTSKGQRPNVSRKLVNLMRSERRANPRISMTLAKMAHRNEIAKRQDKTSKEAFQRILERESVEHQALTLYEKYKGAYYMSRKNDRRSYCTWSACVQAIVTDWVPSFHSKWAPRLIVEEDKKTKKA